MSVKKIQKDGCYITKTIYNKENCLVLETQWKDSFNIIIKDNQIKHIRLSEFSGWKDDKIDFITHMPELEGVEIYSSKINDLTPLTKLPKLKNLALECPYKAIDFSVLTMLEALFIRWRPKSESIFEISTIINLNIVNYPETDLYQLQKMKDLKSIKLTSQKLNSLRGIESFKNLISVDLFRCSKLETLNNIEQCKTLENIEIESCKNISEITPIKNNTNLKRISINNCGEIKSLIDLKGLKELEEIIFVDNTKILDGNLSFFKELPKLKNARFADRKHYSIKRESINSQLTP